MTTNLSLLHAPDALPLLPPTTVEGWGPTVVVAPHPDDESIGCGGAIRLLRDAGVPVRVVVVSDGSGSHPSSRRYPPAALRALREREALDALAILGVESHDIRFLGLPDRAVPTADVEGFAEAVTAMVAALAGPWVPQTVLTPWRRDPHGDHRASWQIVAAAIDRLPQRPRVIEYPVWVWELGDVADEPRTGEVDAWILDITSAIPAKLAAIAAHRSQTTDLIDDDPEGFRLPESMIERVRQPWEVYCEGREGPHPPAPSPTGRGGVRDRKLLPPFHEVSSVTEAGRDERFLTVAPGDNSPLSPRAGHPLGGGDGGVRSLPPAYFERMYAADPDPWGFETRPYEAAKYAATVAALPRERYRSGFEIGCSVGVLTSLLAERCDALLAVDVSARALERASERNAARPTVRFARMRVPEEMPDERFDLIVVSEVGYYWSWEDLEQARGAIVERLVPGGHLLLVHWTPFVEDYPLTGDEVHDDFLAHTAPSLRHLGGRREELYRLDAFERASEG